MDNLRVIQCYLRGFKGQEGYEGDWRGFKGDLMGLNGD